MARGLPPRKPWSGENPAHPAQVVSRIAIAGPSTIDRAVQAADTAAQQWFAVPVDGRVAVLRRAVDELSGLSARIPQLETREVGKPIADSAGELRSAQALAHAMIDRAEVRRLAGRR